MKRIKRGRSWVGYATVFMSSPTHDLGGRLGIYRSKKDVKRVLPWFNNVVEVVRVKIVEVGK